MSSTRTATNGAAAPGAVQLNLRISDTLSAKLDAWLVELNRDRRIPLTRADVMRGALDWACDNRPDWEQR